MPIVNGSNDETPGNDAVVILSHASWQRLFGGAPDVLGQPVTIDGRSYAAIGVMPIAFRFPDTQTQLWTREIGIRVALGAERSRVTSLVLGQSLVLIGMGMTLGLAGAVAGARYLQGMLFGLTPLDVPTFAAVALLFAAIALIAALIPARRAAKVDPLVALREG